MSSYLTRPISKQKGFNFIILIPLILSAFTHLWNPLGFPSIYVDEGHYLRRAMQVLDGAGPQEVAQSYNEHKSYDHPYFGQIILAFLLKVVSYPSSLDPSVDDASSIQDLYLVPRILMGLFAVVDTIFVYKIAEHRYNRNVALIASVLFAVMPMTWLLRRVLLDNILLLFLLSSIFFAIYFNSKLNLRFGRDITLVILSGIFLGLAIFTKVPSFVFIPLISYIIISPINKNNWRRGWKALVILLIPALLIPSMWPVYAIRYDQFDVFMEGIQWQTNRIPRPLFDPVGSIINIDPVLVVLGILGGVYATIRRDYFFILWVVPYILFLGLFIGYSQYIHLVLLFPLFCITSGIILEAISKKLRKILLKADRFRKIRMHEIQQTISNYFDPNEYSSNHKTEEIWEQNPEYGAAVHKNTRISILADRMHIILLVVVGTFGLLWTFMLISTDVNSSFFEAYSNLVKYLPDDTEEDGTTLVSSKKWGIYFYWIPKYIFDKNVLFSDELAREIPQTEKVITIGASPKDKDKSLILNSTLVGEVSNMARNYDREIYPYTNMMYNELAELNIEANY